MASYGEMYVSSAAATTVTTSGTPVKVAGTTTAGDLKDFSMPTDNRLVFNGTSTKMCKIDIFVSATQSVNSTRWTEWSIAKNGTVIAATKIQRDHSNNTDRGASAIGALISMDPDDYLEIYVDHETSGSTATAHQMIVTAHD